MNNSNFWSNFEEFSDDFIILQGENNKSSKENATIISGTGTLTATREENDQDAVNKGYSTIPINLSCGTKTLTETREENDQDTSNREYSTIPIGLSCGTNTMTKTREEADQDKSCESYFAIPTNPRDCK